MIFAVRRIAGSSCNTVAPPMAVGPAQRQRRDDGPHLVADGHCHSPPACDRLIFHGGIVCASIWQTAPLAVQQAVQHADLQIARYNASREGVQHPIERWEALHQTVHLAMKQAADAIQVYAEGEDWPGHWPAVDWDGTAVEVDGFDNDDPDDEHARTLAALSDCRLTSLSHVEVIPPADAYRILHSQLPAWPQHEDRRLAGDHSRP